MQEQQQKFLIGAGGILLLAILVGSFWIAHPKPPARRLEPVAAKPSLAFPPFPKGRGKIAIVLDDWGYNRNQLQALTSIPQPLTVAVLPKLPFSTQVARAAKGAGHEVILHMPMEAQNLRAAREKGTLTPDMPKEEVLQELQESFASVPCAKGLSNHQGSKATADRKLMEIVLGELKTRSLFFLDSAVTDRSVARQAAKELKIPYARRSVFLDNRSSPGYIRQSLAALAQQAARGGQAIGIGHDRPSTLEVLQLSLPELEKAGYTFVFASELADIP